MRNSSLGDGGLAQALMLIVLGLCPWSALPSDRCGTLFSVDTETATCNTLLNLYGQDMPDVELREQVSRQVYGVSAAQAEAIRQRIAAQKVDNARRLASELEKTQCGRLFPDGLERDVCFWDVGISSRTRSDEEVRKAVLEQIEKMQTDQQFRDGVLTAIRNLKGGRPDWVYVLEAQLAEQERLRRDKEERDSAERRIAAEKESQERHAAAGKKVEQETNDTKANLYRCTGPSGRRFTRDPYDIRVGENCVPVSREEQKRMKAEAARPPTDAEKQKMTARANSMGFWALCGELGRVLRNVDTTPKGQYWEEALIAAARIPASDQGYIRTRRLRIGMDECSVVAVLGRPDALNRTNHARGRSDQLVYRAKGIYVYTDNGVVRSWQE